MRKMIWFMWVFISTLSVTYAGGGMTHMFIAQEAITKLTDPELRHLLQKNLDAYLVGAYYPDSGYVPGTKYGEDSHWDRFIYTFADYIKSKYPDHAKQNPKLVAFLFGCAVHRVSDEVIHWQFYKVLKEKDFHGDSQMAHTFGDLGIDLLLNIDKNQWLTHPLNWWVPVSDLLQVYHRMGKDQYTADEIIKGNIAISLAGYGERLISAPAYPYLQWEMPWGAAHYYNWPDGGILMNEQKVADYQMDLWQYLKKKSTHSIKQQGIKHKYAENFARSPAIAFALALNESGAVSVETKSHDDGSVEIKKPIVHKATKLKALLNQFIAKLTH